MKSLSLLILLFPILAGADPVVATDVAATEKKAEPFAFADFSWLNGNSRQSEFPLDSKYFTGQFTLDVNYIRSFSNPKDHTLTGSTNAGRTGELQVQQLGVGGDFHYQNVRGRLMTQFGMYSTMNPRNDSSPSKGQWNLADAYRYISEAYGGYHFDIWNGLNIDAGLFVSFMGLCSYYNYENWVYQMSYVSTDTPWYFNGIRAQAFFTDRLKAELWLVNGWQSYGMFNDAPGVGFQILWRPTGDLSLVTNNYYGHDTLGIAERMRFHTDNSIQYKYFDRPQSALSKAAFSLTLDMGCENGGGVNCLSNNGKPAQNFFGAMFYNRFWFDHDRFGLTIGGGSITNPGRYLVLIPPINGATATSGTPYFTAAPGDQFRAWDGSLTLDFMPSQFITFRLEYNYRQANVPYFAGGNGVTPTGGNQGSPGSAVAGFQPDLSRIENRITSAMMVRF